VRNVVFLSAGGDRVRVRLTNAFGSRPLQVGAASVALAGSGAGTVPASVRQLRFGGRPSILVAAGGEALSDPVSLRVAALQRLDVSVYLPSATGPATQHFFAAQDNFVASGNQVGTRDSAGSRNTGSASAGTRDLGSSNRSTSGASSRALMSSTIRRCTPVSTSGW